MKTVQMIADEIGVTKATLQNRFFRHLFYCLKFDFDNF